MAVIIDDVPVAPAGPGLRQSVRRRRAHRGAAWAAGHPVRQER
ncbi:hypothetical protein ACRAWD_29940 [Caulobacter segnis]